MRKHVELGGSGGMPPPPEKLWNWDPLSCPEIAMFAKMCLLQVNSKHETTAQYTDTITYTLLL